VVMPNMRCEPSSRIAPVLPLHKGITVSYILRLPCSRVNMPYTMYRRPQSRIRILLRRAPIVTVSLAISVCAACVNLLIPTCQWSNVIRARNGYTAPVWASTFGGDLNHTSASIACRLLCGPETLHYVHRLYHQTPAH